MFFAYKDSLKIKSVEDDTVVFEVEGSATSHGGDYMNEKNATIDIEVYSDRAEEMAKKILEL
jgi:hypothetical protein